MAACNGYHIWCATITAILLTSVVNAQFSMPLNDISDMGLGMMGIPPNSSITSTVHSIGKLLERPSVGEVIKRITKIMSGGMSTYMDNNNYTVNGECLTHMQMTMNALMNRESWALRMVDAIGKPHSDLMDLYIKWLGSYEECVNTKALIYANPGTKTDPTSPFKGKYCRAILVIGGDPNQPIMTAQLTVGLCLPSSCNAADVQAFASTLVSLVPVNTTGMPPPSAVCQEDSLEYTTKAIAVLTVCAVIGAVIVIATIYDVAVNCFMVGKKRKHQVEPLPRHGSPSENGMVNHNGIPDSVPLRTFKRIDMDIPTSVYTVAGGGLGDRKPDGQRLEVDLGDTEAKQGNKYGLLSKILVSFSLYTNLGRIMNTNQPTGTLTAVHGIRFISMSWVILGHAFSGGLAIYEQNMSKLVPDMFNRITFHAIGNATFSVDTFFLLSGLLVGYLSLKELKKVKGVRHFNWIMFYFHRYWRLTPPYMLVLMVYVPTLKYWSNGPLWPQTGMQNDECKGTWWWNMLYINNLVDPVKQCMGWGWYLANDMQFYVISPLMFIPLYYSRVLGSISCLLFVAAHVVSSAVISWDNELSSNLFFSQKNEQYVQLYVKPWCRVGVYAVGMFTGYLLYRNNCKLKLPKTVRIIGWQVAAVVSLLVLYGLWNPDGWEPDLNRAATTFYNATSRVAWAVCVCWVILNCATGQGGAVNTFLSWPGFIPLSRLSYCAYLVHPLIQTLYFYSKRSLLYYTDIEMGYIFAGNMVFAYAAALLTSLAFEAPMMGLEKAILKREKHS